MVIFDSEIWARVPFHFWSVVFFVHGTIVGSFLNVVIHRLPREESIVSPPSHCPHCQYAIPWYLNIPLVTWLWLRGKCANCRAPISARYFAVELLTGLLFLGAWLRCGELHPGVAVILCLLFAGFIAATFIDFEHFIIPDSITVGGIVVGFLLSPLAPGLHGVQSAARAMEASAIGIAVGGGIVYLVLRGGKLLFGRDKFKLLPGTTIIFGAEGLKLPERYAFGFWAFFRKLISGANSLRQPEEEIPYGEMLYRDTDCIEVAATKVVLGERTFENTRLRLYKDRLEIGDEKFDPEPITHLEVTAERIVLPREAMGLGDVKFMAAIGAFLGWQGVLFALTISSLLGAVVGVTLILLKKHEWSKWIPYGPYIAVAAVIWVFWGVKIVIAIMNFSERLWGVAPGG